MRAGVQLTTSRTTMAAAARRYCQQQEHKHKHKNNTNSRQSLDCVVPVLIVTRPLWQRRQGARVLPVL